MQGPRRLLPRLNPFTRVALNKPNRDLSPGFHSMTLFRLVDSGI
jgi:hypothetical protein